MKNTKGKILGYGLIKKGTKKYRNALRFCRKTKKLYGIGFDYSELWNLDCTFYKFLYRKGYIDIDFEKYQWEMSFEEYEKLYEDIKQIIKNKQNQEMCDFILPRLKEFKNRFHGYPVFCDTEKDWKKYIDECIKEIEEKHIINKFVDKLGSFWD